MKFIPEKHVHNTKLDSYICITFTESIPLLLGYYSPRVSSCLVVSVSALSQFLRYITYYWILLFLNNINITKTNVT